MTTPDALRDAEYIADVSNIPYDDGDDDVLPDQTRTARSSDEKGIRARAKVVLLERLLRDFDILIYCQLSLLYYMDCSILHLAIRAIVQLLFFTPKTGPFPETPNNQPYIVAILTSNISCVLLHLLSANPVGTEAMRGYLHGGLFIDFIGQKGPITTSQLLTFDFVVAAFQIMMLGIIIERERTKRVLSYDSAGAPTAGQAEAQDYDAEERGVRRSEEHGAETMDGIELQELRTNTDEQDNERSGLLSDMPNEPERDRHPRDVFSSGEAVVMKMDIIHVLRDQWRYTPTMSGARSADASASRERARNYLRRRMGIHLRRNI